MVWDHPPLPAPLPQVLQGLQTGTLQVPTSADVSEGDDMAGRKKNKSYAEVIDVDGVPMLGHFTRKPTEGDKESFRAIVRAAHKQIAAYESEHPEVAQAMGERQLEAIERIRNRNIRSAREKRKK